MKPLFDITLLLSLLATGVVSLNDNDDNGARRRLQKSSHRAGSRSRSRRVEERCQSVDDVICGMKDTTIFCEMVTSFSKVYKAFADGLEGGRPYTVFAFTDDAYKAVEQEFLQLSAVEIYRTLLFHFYEGIVLTYNELDCAQKLTSLTGDKSRTKCQRISAGVYNKSQRGKGNQEIGDWPKVIIENGNGSQEACTGIVHRIDSIMLPKLFPSFEALVGVVNDADADDNDVIVAPEIVDANSVYFNSDEKDKDKFLAFVIDAETTVVPEEDEDELPEATQATVAGTVAPTLTETEALNDKGKDAIKKDKEDDAKDNAILPIEEINNTVIGIGENENTAISWGNTYVDLGEAVNIELEEDAPALAGIDFDRDNKDDFGADGSVAGTQLEITEVSPENENAAQTEAEQDDPLLIDDDDDDDDDDEEGIGVVLALNMIVFSALVFCFFGWISRMIWCPETTTFKAIRLCMIKKFKKPITVSVAREPTSRRDRNTSNKSGCWMPGAEWTPNRNSSGIISNSRRPPNQNSSGIISNKRK